jgi:hypothetical protein
MIESSARGLSLQKRERIIFHLSFFICHLPDLSRVASCAFVDRALGRGKKSDPRITRTGTKHNDQWGMTNPEFNFEVQL